MPERGRAILHIDMDAFYASVEQRDHPELKGKPVLVGGPSKRGVVAAASYEARVFGVHSAMPMAQALRKCPKAIVVSGRHSRYSEVSHAVFEIFAQYTPLVEGLSLDEAFLDVTGSRSLFGDGETIARSIRHDIKSRLDLTASAGVAASKFVAKIASDVNKPDGLTVVPADVAAFLAPLPVERMWGVGPKTAPLLRSLGLCTLGDLARADDKTLVRVLGEWGAVAKRLARGDDARDVEPHRDAKSISHESTYEHDLATLEEIDRALLSHAEHVAERLANAGLLTRSVTIKIKFHDFSVRTATSRLETPSLDTQTLYEAAVRARGRVTELSRGRVDKPVRLVGLGADGLLDEDRRPLVLFEDAANRKRTVVEKTLMQLKTKLGTAVTRASLLEEDDEVTDEEGRVDRRF
jgi:DNA polymerase-4